MASTGWKEAEKSTVCYSYFFFIFQNIENIKNYQKESKQIKLGNPLGFGEFGEVSKGKNYQLTQT